MLPQPGHCVPIERTARTELRPASGKISFRNCGRPECPLPGSVVTCLSLGENRPALHSASQSSDPSSRLTGALSPAEAPTTWPPSTVKPSSCSRLRADPRHGRPDAAVVVPGPPNERSRGLSRYDPCSSIWRQAAPHPRSRRQYERSRARRRVAASSVIAETRRPEQAPNGAAFQSYRSATPSCPGSRRFACETSRPRGSSGFVERGNTISRTSMSTSRATPWSSSPACRDRANRRSPSPPSMPRRSAGIWNRSRPMRVACSIRWKYPRSMRSRACLRRWHCSSSADRRPPAPRSAA